MFERYDFWTHGVNVQIEFPEKTSYVQRAGYGTVVRQAAGTDNWFHIAIPTPTVLESDGSIYLKYIRLTMKLNKDAQVDRVHLWEGDKRIGEWNGLSLMGMNVNQRFDPKDHNTEGGIVVCVHVNFLKGEKVGEVVFLGAGGRFDDTNTFPPIP